MNYYGKYKGITTKLKKVFRQPIQDALEGQINAFIKEFEANEHAHPMELPTKPLEVILTQLYKAGGVSMAKVVATQIKRDMTKGKDDDESLYEYVIRNYYKTFLLSDIVLPITETTKEQIRRVLADKLKYGWGIAETVRHLKDSDLTKYRAELIVRTESMRAANTGAMIGAAGSNVAVMKRWVSAQDNRTRRIPRNNFDHLHMNGATVDFDKPFIVPSLVAVEAMQMPGDPDASAGNVCNCRCCVAFVPIRDNQGNLVLTEDYAPQNGSIFRSLFNAAMEGRNSLV